jgi:hypothetical protein
MWSRAADEPVDYQLLHRNRLSQATISMDASGYAGLTSQGFNDRLLAALQALILSWKLPEFTICSRLTEVCTRRSRPANREHRVARSAGDTTSIAQQRAAKVA